MLSFCFGDNHTTGKLIGCFAIFCFGIFDEWCVAIKTYNFNIVVDTFCVAEPNNLPYLFSILPYQFISSRDRNRSC